MDEGILGKAWRSLTGRSDAALRLKRLQQEYAAAGMVLGGRGFLSGIATVRSTRGGVAFSQVLLPSNRSNSAHVLIGVDIAIDEDLQVTREDGSDALAKRIGFASEVQTGDTAFDGEFYLAGRSPEFVAALFRLEQNRAAVRALFAQGFDRIELASGSLSARKPGGHEPLELVALFAAVDSLARLRAAAVAARPMLPAPRGQTTTQLALISSGAFIALMVPFLSAIQLGRPLVDGTLGIAFTALPWIVLATLASIAWMVLKLRGRPNAHRELMLVAVAALFGVPMAGWGVAVLANERLDDSEAIAYQVQVVGKYATHGKRDHFYVELKSWRAGKQAESIEVPRVVYDRTRNLQTLIVHTHAGRLGCEWVESVGDGQWHIKL